MRVSNGEIITIILQYVICMLFLPEVYKEQYFWKKLFFSASWSVGAYLINVFWPLLPYSQLFMVIGGVDPWSFYSIFDKLDGYVEIVSLKTPHVENKLSKDLKLIILIQTPRVDYIRQFLINTMVCIYCYIDSKSHF